jgi:Rod binding domain-containing protein
MDGIVKSVAGSPASPSSATKSSSKKDDPARVTHAAQEFESLLIAQLLKSMRESDSGGWLGTGSDQAGAHAMELAEEQLAQALAHQGGLGLAKLVVSGLKRAEGGAGDQTAGTGPQKLQP